MKTIELKVYKFGELTPDLQEKLIEDNRDALVEDDSWFEPIIDGFCEDMGELGHEIAFKDISFTGFWSQGDGARFTTYNGSLLTRALFKESGIKLKDLPKGFGKEMDDGLIQLDLKRNGLRYCHENTVELHYSYDGENEAIEDAICENISPIADMLRDKMRKLYADLEKHHEALRSDEVVKEELIELESDYTITGEVFSI